MIIKEFSASSMDNRNYLLIDENSKKATLIDASENPSKILEELDNSDIKLENIFLTHGHFDHVLGVNKIREKTGAKVFVHVNDAFMLDKINEIMQLFGMGPYETQKYDETFSDGDIFHICNTEMTVIHTSGHTEGSVSFLIDGKLFSGDTLFKESVGRTDLPGGSFKKLAESIKKLFKLDDNTVVYPGHGECTTIGYEKVNNEIINYL